MIFHNVSYLDLDQIGITKKYCMVRVNNVFLDHSLGVDRSVRVIESPDDIVSKPGTRHYGTQA